MNRLRVLAVVLALGASACASADPSGAPSATPTRTPGVLPAEATPRPTDPPPTGSLGPGVEVDVEPFDPTNFSDPTTITNDWLPLKPGSQWQFEGTAEIDGVVRTRQVVLAITDLTKEIAGIRTVVGYELDYTDDVLSEAELAFWAQDDDGTIWRMGEYPEVYEDGELAETPAWFHGFEEAAAGIAMQAQPRPFTASYSQGWGPAVGWTDRGRVFEVDSETCVPFDCYTGVLVIAEFSRDDPDVYQFKYYARGVGGVRVGWAGAREEEHEVLELEEYITLNEAEMNAIRDAALAQEARGYELSDVYALTPRLERIGG